MRRNALALRWLLKIGPALGLMAGVASVVSLSAGPQNPDSGDDRYRVVRHVLSAAPGGGYAISEEVEYVEVSAAFVVNKHIWAQSSLPLQVKYNPEGAPSEHQGESLIQQAIGTWNAAGSGFSFAYAGLAATDTASCDPGPPYETDGTNTIKFEELAGLVLGITCSIYPPGGANTPLIEFDMRLDNDTPWSTTLPIPTNRFDLATTLLHELGHATGLGHSAQQSSVMFRLLNSGQTKRELTQDDIDGIRAAYPPTVTATPTNTPTPVPTLATVVVEVRAPQLARD